MFLKPLLSVVLCLLTFAVVAQADSLGQWRTYQSFSSGTYVTESEDAIIYTTGRAIFYLDKEDLSISRLTRTEGLTDASISLIRYHRPTGTLIIVYENSTIDLYQDGRFSTLRQVDNFNFSGDKTIYDLSFGADNTVYLAAGFGISALSLNDLTFRFTTLTGIGVNSVVEYNDNIYAATDEGLYRVATSGVNLNDFGSWNLLGFNDGLPGDYGSTATGVYRDALYFAVNEDIWKFQDTFALHTDSDPGEYRVQYLSPGPNYLLAGYRCTTSSCNDRQVLVLNENPGRVSRPGGCFFRTTYAIEDEQGRIWFSDDAEGIRYFPALGQPCVEISYPGPPNDRNYRLLHDGTSLWVAPGVLDENFSPEFSFDGVFRYRDGEWTVFSLQNTTAFLGRDGVDGGGDEVATIIDIHYDESNDIHYFSSFYEGAVALEDGEATLLDETNTSLQLSPDAGPGRVRVAGAATDSRGFTYLAVNRAGGGGIISVRNPAGEWAVLGEGCALNIAINIIVDDADRVWVVHPGEGITVLDTGGTPMDASDDFCRNITTSNSNLPTNGVRSIAVSRDGVIWVGTTEGILTFDCFDLRDGEQCQGTAPVAEDVDGNGFLLGTEQIRAITFDGGDRKWIATNSGVYLLATDDTQLLFFDKDNSPLLDNLVRDITINPNDGTVFFGTEGGIISYRGDATSAGQTFREELTVFPNPVEPGYSGPVSISGLARDANVKITDLSGKLVAEGNANGGLFTWSGEDYNGRRVTTGVYLIFASSAGDSSLNKPNSAVGKIVFIR